MPGGRDVHALPGTGLAASLAHPGYAAALIAVLAIWGVTAFRARKRITWAVDLDMPVGLAPGQAPGAAWTMIFGEHSPRPAEPGPDRAAQGWLVLVAVTNTGLMPVRGKDFRAPLVFRFPGREVCAARIRPDPGSLRPGALPGGTIAAVRPDRPPVSRWGTRVRRRGRPTGSDAPGPAPRRRQLTRPAAAASGKAGSSSPHGRASAQTPRQSPPTPSPKTTRRASASSAARADPRPARAGARHRRPGGKLSRLGGSGAAGPVAPTWLSVPAGRGGRREASACPTDSGQSMSTRSA